MSVCHIHLLSDTPMWLAFSLLLFTIILIQFDCMAKESILNLWQVEEIGFLSKVCRLAWGPT